MEEIVDIGSTEFRRGNLKRRLLRIVVPIACVALMMASILGIALYSYSNNRRDALALSEDVLASLDRRIATEVRTFLSPASDLVKIVDRTLVAPFSGVNRRDLAEPLATAAQACERAQRPEDGAYRYLRAARSAALSGDTARATAWLQESVRLAEQAGSASILVEARHFQTLLPRESTPQ